jgi:hypothetical protein
LRSLSRQKCLEKRIALPTTRAAPAMGTMMGSPDESITSPAEPAMNVIRDVIRVAVMTET